MPELNELILSIVGQYGPLTLALAMFLSAAGLPLPVTPLVVTAGACARQEPIAVPAAPILILAGVMLGDLVSYTIGRFTGGRISDGNSRSAKLLDVARERFTRHGALALFFTQHSGFPRCSNKSRCWRQPVLHLPLSCCHTNRTGRVARLMLQSRLYV